MKYEYRSGDIIRKRSGEICTTSTVNISKTNKENLMWFSLFTFSQQRAFIFITKKQLLI